MHSCSPSECWRFDSFSRHATSREEVKSMQCEHYWVPGDVRSDWICANCGERADIPEVNVMNAYVVNTQPHTACVSKEACARVLVVSSHMLPLTPRAGGVFFLPVRGYQSVLELLCVGVCTVIILFIFLWKR